MLKLSILFVCCLYLISGLKADTCPKYRSIENFDAKKLTGVWYLIASNSENYNPTLKCPKANVILNANGTSTTQTSIIFIDDSEINVEQLTEEDPENPGTFIYEEEVKDESIFGTDERKIELRSSVVYTDYTNIVAFFACYDSKENLFPKANRMFTILVRDRAFDSLKEFGTALGEIKKYGGDINDLRFWYNGANCKN